MNIYKVEAKKPRDYDQYWGFVIQARSKHGARMVAVEAATKAEWIFDQDIPEEHRFWMSEEDVEVTLIGITDHHPLMMTNSEDTKVIMGDFHAG